MYIFYIITNIYISLFHILKRDHIKTDCSHVNSNYYTSRAYRNHAIAIVGFDTGRAKSFLCLVVPLRWTRFQRFHNRMSGEHGMRDRDIVCVYGGTCRHTSGSTTKHRYAA